MSDIEALYRDYFPRVYRYVFSLCRDEVTAEDVTNETFLKAIKGINRFKGDCDVKVWLCQIAKNTYFSQLKTQKDTVSLNAIPEIECSDEDFTKRLADHDAAFEVFRSLHQLPEPYQEVFSLRIFAELSFAEIAELFDKTEGWARVTYHRAKSRLKESLS